MVRKTRSQITSAENKQTPVTHVHVEGHSPLGRACQHRAHSRAPAKWSVVTRIYRGSTLCCFALFPAKFPSWMKNSAEPDNLCSLLNTASRGQRDRQKQVSLWWSSGLNAWTNLSETSLSWLVCFAQFNSGRSKYLLSRSTAAARQIYVHSSIRTRSQNAHSSILADLADLARRAPHITCFPSILLSSNSASPEVPNSKIRHVCAR